VTSGQPAREPSRHHRSGSEPLLIDAIRAVLAIVLVALALAGLAGFGAMGATGLPVDGPAP
jgi:hypothetical protein